MVSEPASVVFPLRDGRRSTSALGQGVVADALAAVDPAGAESTRRETNWRTGYIAPMRHLVVAGLGSADDAREIATAGLASLHSQMMYRTGEDEVPLREAVLASSARTKLATETISGGGRREEQLTVPRRGQRLAGDEIRAFMDRLVRIQAVEPSFAQAITDVVDHPEWLDLRGRTVAVMGIGAEMGPYRSLMRWGATVAGIDLPRPGIWDRAIAHAHSGAGALLIPVRPGDEPRGARAGIDVSADPAAAAQWLTGIPGDELVIGNYVYADGATNVVAASALDAITEAVRSQRPNSALAFLATPTDAFAVPREAVIASNAAYQRRTAQVLRAPLRGISGGRLLKPNYRPDEDPGLIDAIVPQQGPNYLLAKRIHRWRATVARAEGTTVSMHVAPPTRTRSVLKNRALRAAYAGAHRFGVTTFEPGTANTLMAALLVHDLVAGVPSFDHPWQDEAYAAAHGGLWRTAYDPRSALGLAAVLGFGSPG